MQSIYRKSIEQCLAQCKDSYMSAIPAYIFVDSDFTNLADDCPPLASFYLRNWVTKGTPEESSAVTIFY